MLAGEEIHFHGATGPINLDECGRAHALTYDIWQHQEDGPSKVVNVVRLEP